MTVPLEAFATVAEPESDLSPFAIFGTIVPAYVAGELPRAIAAERIAAILRHLQDSRRTASDLLTKDEAGVRSLISLAEEELGGVTPDMRLLPVAAPSTEKDQALALLFKEVSRLLYGLPRQDAM
jgi:hypothetical protein